MTALGWIATTILVYAACLRLQRAMGGAPLANPTLGTIVLVALLLALSGTRPETYLHATAALSFLLAPATVALGVPLAANLGAVRRDLSRVLAAIAAGATAAAASGAVLIHVLGGSTALARTMLPKAATTPIAMAVAHEIGGVPPLAATFAIAGGLVIALVLEPCLRVLGISDAATSGLAAGTAGSGVGAAAASRLGERQAAFAAMGVGLTGLATALLARPLARILGLL